MTKELSAILSATAAQKKRTKTNVVRKGGSGAKQGFFSRVADLYKRMEDAYAAKASEAGLTCAGCADNCCTSFFRHHTYVEWIYLWRGLQELTQAQQQEIRMRAERYMHEARLCLATGTMPRAMCPLNQDGLCILYSHRLMICRMHGTRNIFTLPDGRERFFPGCWRFQTLPCAQNASPPDPTMKVPAEQNPPEHHSAGQACPTLDRTPLYKELAALEMEFLHRAGRSMPHVNLTLAEMILLGPPRLR